MTKPLILALSGSLRAHSFNTAILETMAADFADLADMHLHSLADIPAYNEDLDGDLSPEPVVRLREAIGAAAGLVLASPEYNHGMSGVLKNALDWASRPRFGTTLLYKPVLNITSSVAFIGGVRAHQQLNETLLSIPARIVLHPPVVIPDVHKRIVGGRLIDPDNLAFLRESFEELLRMSCNKIHGVNK